MWTNLTHTLPTYTIRLPTHTLKTVASYIFSARAKFVYFVKKRLSDPSQCISYGTAPLTRHAPRAMLTPHVRQNMSSTTLIEWGYQMAKTACQSDAGFRRYKLLKSVMVLSCLVGPLMCEKNPVSSEDSRVLLTRN